VEFEWDEAKRGTNIANHGFDFAAWDGIPEEWYKDVVLVMRGSKRLISLRIDDDVLDWFKAQGPGYQTRVNAVLRSFMVQAQRAGGTG